MPILALAAFTVSATAQTITVNKDNRTIAITATGSAEQEADTAEVSIGFNTFGTGQNQTYADASKVSNQIIDALLHAGITRSQIHSDDQKLTAIDPNDSLRYKQGLRFSFLQTWTVTVKAADAAGVLHLAITAGANDSGNITWKLSDENHLQAEAAANALAHARHLAQSMAEGLNVQLGPLVYASNQAPQSAIQRILSQETLATLSAEKPISNRSQSSPRRSPNRPQSTQSSPSIHITKPLSSAPPSN